MALKRRWLPILWGVGLGVATGSFLWGSSRAAGLVIGEKIIFTLVVPLASLGLCLAISMATSGRNGPPSPPIR